MLLADPQLALLIDRRVHEEAQEHRRRAIDGHRDRSRVGGEVESRIELLGVVDGGNRHPGIAHLAVDVRPACRILAVQRHRVEGGRESLGGLTEGHVVKSLVGALRAAFTGKHACRIFTLALQRKDACRERKHTGNVLGQDPPQDLAPVFVAWQDHFGNLQVRQRLGVEVLLENPVTHLKAIPLGAIAALGGRPLAQHLPAIGIEALFQSVVAVDEIVQVGHLGLGASQRPHQHALLVFDDLRRLFADLGA